MNDSGKFSNFGPLNSELEGRLASLFRVAPSQVVTASSATLALQGAVAVSGADSFIVPAFTFAATPLAVHGAGAKVKFADVSEETWRLEVPPIRDQSGVLDVIPFGSVIELERRRSGNDAIKNLVIDAAASLGSIPPQGLELEPSWSIVFSLHATKVFGIGEGGIAVFGSAERAAEFRQWTNFGFSGRRESVSLGTNCKMSEVSAAYGLASLDGSDSEFDEWRNANQIANSATDGIQIRVDYAVRPTISPYWIVKFRSGRARQLAQERLSEEGVESRQWWPLGCHRMPAFCGFEPQEFPVVDHLAATVLGLPMFRGLTPSDATRVQSALHFAC